MKRERWYKTLEEIVGTTQKWAIENQEELAKMTEEERNTVNYNKIIELVEEKFGKIEYGN